MGERTPATHMAWAVPLVLATLCFGAGFALAQLSLDQDRARLADTADNDSPARPAAPENAPEQTNPDNQAGAPDSAVGEAREPRVSPSAADTSERDPPANRRAPPSEDAATSQRTMAITRGRVAYLRCRGVPPRPGRFPCPRDLQLEQAVWRAVEGLERCPAAVASEIDLRVEFRSSSTGEVTLNADDASVHRLRGCLGEHLQFTTSLTPEDMVVSFRLSTTPR